MDDIHLDVFEAGSRLFPTEGFFGFELFEVFCTHFVHENECDKFGHLSSLSQLKWALKQKKLNTCIRHFVSMGLLALSVEHKRLQSKWKHLLMSPRFRGSSSNGTKLLSKIGIGGGKSSFLRRCKQLRIENGMEIRESKLSLMWIDNCGKALAVQMPRGNNVHKNCQWCAVAIEKHPSVIHPFVKKPCWHIEKGHPQCDITSLFSDKSNWFMRFIDEAEFNLSGVALCLKWDIRHVPIKVTVDAVMRCVADEKKRNAHIKAVKNRVDAPSHVQPCEMNEHNVSANEGPFKISLSSCKQNIPQNCMITVVSDVAICERILKVIHNVPLCCERAGTFATLCVIAQAFWSKSLHILDVRNLIMPVLGWWHSCKFLSMLAWRSHEDIFMPLFAKLHPGQKWKSKPKHIAHIVHFFSLLRVTHSGKKCEMDEILDANWNIDNKESFDKCPACSVHRQHIPEREELDSWRSLLRFCTPLLRDHMIALKVDDFQMLFSLHKNVTAAFANFGHRQCGRNTCMNHIVLEMHRNASTDFWLNFSESPNHGNEEPGESMLSICGRKMIRDTHSEDIKHANECFKIMKTMWNSTKTFCTSMGEGHLQRKQPEIRNNTPNLQKTSNWFMERIKHLVQVVKDKSSHDDDVKCTCNKCCSTANNVDMCKTKLNQQPNCMDKTRIKHHIASFEKQIIELIHSSPEWFRSNVARHHPEHESDSSGTDDTSEHKHDDSDEPSSSEDAMQHDEDDDETSTASIGACLRIVHSATRRQRLQEHTSRDAHTSSVTLHA
eukprot:jgi/Bigna1/70429/fgenesh1_pg.12_\